MQKIILNLKEKPQKIIEVSGAVEITPNLGLSDVVVDITSTVQPLKSNRLKIIDKIMDSSCVIVQRKNLDSAKNRAGKRLAFSY